MIQILDLFYHNHKLENPEPKVELDLQHQTQAFLVKFEQSKPTIMNRQLIAQRQLLSKQKYTKRK